ncbi:hypothetical protein TraAM80_07724 [Trypanosoma rangeli]|uniref:Uncharacterized protein n=1 Tax=Trypanosoma rangeli TaxID=5698 RepID=A0A422N421_TRYRA|nr:uncharacterized protein TraAM80_07724 [Trypanosoma rangeli]RNF00215.1 hypothetical protein TraAM80_07724 [Trypanosoma rangeli]|eukprot:RNF00215.1 hypothetical protein TraAM80_07724 [Trypanosoma rangeli]
MTSAQNHKDAKDCHPRLSVVLILKALTKVDLHPNHLRHPLFNVCLVHRRVTHPTAANGPVALQERRFHYPHAVHKSWSVSRLMSRPIVMGGLDDSTRENATPRERSESSETHASPSAPPQQFLQETFKHKRGGGGTQECQHVIVPFFII